MLSSRPRMALIHPCVARRRGGEKVFFELARLFPHADLFVFHLDPKLLPSDLRARTIKTTFLQRRPLHWAGHRALVPMMPLAAESIDLTGYDFVLSSSFGWAHGVIPPDGAHHVSYMYSPPRYLWGETGYLPGGNHGAAVLGPLLNYLRVWDVTAAQRVDRFLAISSITARRVLSRYRRDAEVVFPPVDIDRFERAGIEGDGKGRYAVAAGELVSYKRFDLAIAACRIARVPLVIVGDGPERRRLRRAADGADVRFVGRVSDSEIERLFAEAFALIHAGVEDFGMVTVEALAAGTPVVGVREGGTGEIVRPGCGVLVDEGDAGSLAEAIVDVRRCRFDRDALMTRARAFDIGTFRRRFTEALDLIRLPG